MPGGIIQLAVYGAQDYYLTSNPQISFFKSVYRRHTNFSMEMINVLPTLENSLSSSTETNIEFAINRNADLVKDMYFVFTLPNIYSTSVEKFQWIRNIGEFIIKEITFNIGSRQIDKQFGEWLHIWAELNLPEGKKDGYNRMIGNVAELYDPESVSGSSSYPSETSVVPSIKERKIYVPLQFWFNQSYGNAFPLIAMQYDSAPVIRITLRKLNELYTIIDSSNRIAPNSSYNIGKFLEYNNTDSTTTNLSINPSLEVNYIFLDKQERKRFAIVEHEYLIKQIQRVETEIAPTTSEKANNIELKIQHPISDINWIARRTDLEAVNQWHNFTNWPLQDYDPTISSYLTPDTNPFGSEYTINSTTYPSLKHKNIIKSATLRLNGFERFDTKDSDMFNLVNNYQHHQRISKDGINTYSFSLETYKYQPSGTCNMSRFNPIELQVTTVPHASSSITGTSASPPYDYNVYIYAVNYNIFRMIGGLGDVEFSS